ncbi:unnamed protein product [Clonostachys rhizophaga]|uniref:Uncharacterized protein n=1 Tax=Clonostachys rhizophaga TaxID=160324 RepID=A0A9N9VKZ7_9HYPO|nr:unnamed protein product [Clonostachys rhizophaga]
MAQKPAFDPFDETEEALEAHRDYVVEIHQITLLSERGTMRYAFMTFDETARNGDTGLVLHRKLVTGHHGISYHVSSSTFYMGSRESVNFVIQEGFQVGDRGPDPFHCRSTPKPSDATLVAKFHASHESQLFSSVKYSSEYEGNLMLDDAEWADGTSLGPYQAPDEDEPVLLGLVSELM